MLNLTEEQLTIAIRAVDDFDYFMHNIFALSFPDWHGGAFVTEVAEFMQYNPKTARIGARDHLKSTGVYGYLMWRLLKSFGKNEDWDYFSFQAKMAKHHIAKIKRLITGNPYFQSLIDLKPTSEGTIQYSWIGDAAHIFSVTPHGMLAFKRGLHGYGAIVDDPFQDPENKLLLTVIKKINSVFVTQIMDIPSHELHVVGTAQTNYDFFFDKKIMSRFAVMIKPAVKTAKAPDQWTDADVAWPEHMNANELRARLVERGRKIFNQEYLVTPAYAENSFFKEVDLQKVIQSNPPLSYRIPYETKNTMVGGWDLGKKSHPAHLVVYEIIRTVEQPPTPPVNPLSITTPAPPPAKVVKTVWVQRLQFWMDGWDYTKQVEFAHTIIQNLKVDKLFYDNTRGELESLAEQHLLKPQLKPVVFSAKTKAAMATEFEKAVNNGTIILLDDPRQLEQILAVTNDLDAQEGPNGHGDSFWSNALCFQYLLANQFSFSAL